MEKDCRKELEGEAAVVGELFRAIRGWGVVLWPRGSRWDGRGGRVRVVVEGMRDKSREEMEEFMFLTGTSGYVIASYPSREKGEPGVDDQENKGERKEGV